MPTNNDDFLLKKIQEATESGQDMDPWVKPSIRNKPPTININGKDAEVTPDPMPNFDRAPKTANRLDDLVHRYATGQDRNITDFKRGIKKGGTISLEDCKVNTAESKNSKHKNCW